jgi:hypothetical protein
MTSYGWHLKHPRGRRIFAHTGIVHLEDIIHGRLNVVLKKACFMTGSRILVFGGGWTYEPTFDQSHRISRSSKRFVQNIVEEKQLLSTHR